MEVILTSHVTALYTLKDAQAYTIASMLLTLELHKKCGSVLSTYVVYNIPNSYIVIHVISCNHQERSMSVLLLCTQNAEI